MNDAELPFTLLVNSCDAFEDCWAPFFCLLERYWSAPRPSIVLNTERKLWAHNNFDIRCTQVQMETQHRLTWSECLSAALASIDTPLVLYMQEDYFIEKPVDVEAISALAQRMIDDPSIRHIGLTHFGAGSPILPDWRPMLSRIGPRATYRVSTQAGLWRTDALQSYLLPWESGWMFELFGTIRSWKRDELFLTIDRNLTSPAIEYQHTGIVKGQWSNFVPPLFEREGIAVDFETRGFFDDDGSSFLRRIKLLSNIASNPIATFNSIVRN
jgi:hypothetical protein